MFLVLTLAACSDKWGKGSGSSEANDGEEPAPLPIPSVLAQPPVQRPAVIDMQGRPMSFAPLVAQSDAAVATVKAVQMGTVRGREQPVKEGLGTAFVYDPVGYLLTNHHVIEAATNITIGFKDGRDLPATVVGSDKRTDIAVLKVEATNLPALPLGDSEELLVGDWVVAIGNPFGLSHTVSAGILSAKGRTRDDVSGLDPAGYFDFLQTDASINPGNSGGPLLNLKGEVVGINAAIRANANNIGFAIPMNMVKQLLPILLRDGKVKRSALGVIVGDLSIDQASRLGRAVTKGAWVKGLQGGGPAERAGIEVDDVIISFNGKPIDDQNQLRWFASIGGVGQTATVRVFRDRKELDLKVVLSELPETDN
ncbi:MAG: trypsin-like peptidase domain-containing protein [Polyangiaceae bacterium]|nr:trypsin-like peptidase domain-containing protein [Polyangiaceae bacterium]